MASHAFSRDDQAPIERRSSTRQTRPAPRDDGDWCLAAYRTTVWISSTLVGLAAANGIPDVRVRDRSRRSCPTEPRQ